MIFSESSITSSSSGFDDTVLNFSTGGNNADAGALGLIETANFCYGSAMMIFASVLFMRIITNTIIPHPRNKVTTPCALTRFIPPPYPSTNTQPLLPSFLPSSLFQIGEPGIAYYETTMLAFAVAGTMFG